MKTALRYFQYIIITCKLGTVTSCRAIQEGRRLGTHTVELPGRDFDPFIQYLPGVYFSLGDVPQCPVQEHQFVKRAEPAGDGVVGPHVIFFGHGIIFVAFVAVWDSRCGRCRGCPGSRRRSRCRRHRTAGRRDTAVPGRDIPIQTGRGPEGWPRCGVLSCPVGQKGDSGRRR